MNTKKRTLILCPPYRRITSGVILTGDILVWIRDTSSDAIVRAIDLCNKEVSIAENLGYYVFRSYLS